VANGWLRLNEGLGIATDIHEYKEAVKLSYPTSDNMSKALSGLYDLLDELEMVGFVYCDDVQ